MASDKRAPTYAEALKLHQEAAAAFARAEGCVDGTRMLIEYARAGALASLAHSASTLRLIAPVAYQ